MSSTRAAPSPRPATPRVAVIGCGYWGKNLVRNFHALGEYSLIAAGAVVNRDVPPHAMVAGVPAKRIGWVSHTGEPLGEDLVCPRTGRRYRCRGKDKLEEIRDT